MRKILWLPLLTAVCAFTSLRADFTLVEHIDGIPNADSTILFKGGRTRVGPSNGANDGDTLIMDLKSGEMIMLINARKTYFKVPSQMAQAAIDMMKQSPGMPKNGGMVLTPAGQKDTILGCAADEYTGANKGRKMTVWLTKAAPEDADILREMSAAFAQGLQAGYLRGPMAAVLGSIGPGLAALPGLPVRASYEEASGQILTSTLLSISAKPIDDSEFDIPGDYKQIDMPPARGRTEPPPDGASHS